MFCQDIDQSVIFHVIVKNQKKSMYIFEVVYLTKTIKVIKYLYINFHLAHTPNLDMITNHAWFNQHKLLSYKMHHK